MPHPQDHPQTPDGRYFVFNGRLWRLSNPALSSSDRQFWVDQLMAARRQVGRALKARDRPMEKTARTAVDAAKRALGERGPVWWTDGSPDLNRRLVRNTPYRAWFDKQKAGAEPKVKSDLAGHPGTQSPQGALTNASVTHRSRA